MLTPRLLLTAALTLVPTLALASAGGPDAFGYTWLDQNEPGVNSTIPPATGPATVITVAAESLSAPVNFGFTFPFYGGSYTQFKLSDNGFVTLDVAATASPMSPTGVPSASAPNLVVAWLWRNLNPPTIAQYYPFAGGGYLLLRHTGLPGGETVQAFVAFYATGMIKIRYAAAGDSSAAAVGIENATGTDGLSPWLRGVGTNGFVLDGTSIVQIQPPPKLVCTAPQPISCGQTLSTANPPTVPVNVTDYLCSGNQYLGLEKIIEFDNPGLADVTFQLTSLPPGVDLDIFVLRAGMCNEFQCISGPGDLLTIPFLPAGRYEIVVDGRLATDVGPFDLRVTCTPKSATTSCGAIGVRGTTSGTSQWSLYPCTNLTLDGPEFIYEVPMTAPGNLKVVMTPDPGVELDLVAFGPDLFNPPGGCLQWGDTNLTLFDPPLGNYFVMVEGRSEGGTRPNAGGFSLDINCDVLLDCTAPAGDLTCFTETAGTTIGAPNRAEQYSCSPDLFNGGEVVYNFSNSTTRTVSFMYTGPPGLTLLLVNDTCNEGACFEFGDGRLIARDLPAGNWYVVVDGRSGATGNFTITPICGNDIDPATGFWVLRNGEFVHETKLASINADIDRGDVMFVMDTSGSMTGPINALKRTSQDIIVELSAVINDVEFGLASFEDHPRSYSECGYSSSYGGGADLPYRLNLAMTNDQAALFTAIDSLVATGGGDGPESYVYAYQAMIFDAGNIGWRPGARRIVVMVGDDEPHSCDTTLCGPRTNTGANPGPDWLGGTPDDRDINLVMDDLKAQAITPVYLNTNGAGRPGLTAQWQCWMARGGGSGYDAPGGSAPPTLVEDLRILIEEKSKMCDVLEIRGSPGYELWVTGATGPFTTVSLPARVYFDFDIGPPPGTPPGTYTFTVDVLCDGIIKTQQFVTIEVPGCAPNPVLTATVEGCTGDARTLDASGSTITECPGAIEYQFKDGVGAVIQPWGPLATLLETPTTTADYTVEIRCVDGVVCPSVGSTTVTVVVTPYPVAFLEPIDSICVGGSITVDASGSIPSGCLVPLEYQFHQGATILQPWSIDSTLGPVGPGSGVSTYEVDVRCTASPGCADTTTQAVEVIPYPVAQIAAIVPICVGTSVTVDASSSIAAGCPVPLEYQFHIGATILQPWSIDATLGPVSPGVSTTYEVDVRCTASPGCANTTTRLVTVVPAPIAAAGADVSECEGVAVVLDGGGSTDVGCPAGLEYEWRDGATVMRPWNSSPTWSTTTGGLGVNTYTLYVRCAGAPGCGGPTDTVVLTRRTCGLAVHFDYYRAVWSTGAVAPFVDIEWKSLTEAGSTLFAVEASDESAEAGFVEIGTRDATGSGSTYRLVDNGAVFGRERWYRVVEYTVDGVGDHSAPFQASSAGPAERGGSTGRRSRQRGVR